jgi:chitinase
LKTQALPRPGATEYHDYDAIASWSYDPTSKTMVTYDTPANAAAKVTYIQQRRLGGAMWWESSGDKAGDGSLINIVSEPDNFLFKCWVSLLIERPGRSRTRWL